MGLESATYLNDLNEAWPVGNLDIKGEGDNHLRVLKGAIKSTFPGLAGRAWRKQTKATAYEIVATDNMSIVQATDAITFSFVSAVTLGNGFVCLVDASNGDVTLDPSSTQLINGAETLVVPNGWTVIVFCDGAGFIALPVPRTGYAETPVIVCLEDSGSQDIAITAGTEKGVWEGFPACTILEIWAGLKTASSSGNVVLDVNLDGTSIMTTNKLLIEATETKTQTAATQPALTTTVIPHLSRISIDYDSAGTGAKGVCIWMAVLLDTTEYP